MATYSAGTAWKTTTTAATLPATWQKWVHTGTGTTTASNITVTADNTWVITTDPAVHTIPNLVWDQWRDVGYTTNYVTWQDPVWDAWERDEEEQARYRRQLDELQAAREQRSREQLALEQQRMEDRIVAHARALDLLDVLLTDEERASRAEHQRIEIRGSDGQLYWLETHRDTVHGNIVRTDEHGCLLGRACVAPGMRNERGALPTADGWIGQYLGLKLDAEQFLSHANWSQVWPCRVPADQPQQEAA